MNLSTFIRAAQKYSDLGWSVQEQLRDVASGEAMSEQNSNALKIISRFLRGVGNDVTESEELADEIDAYLASEDVEAE